MNYYKILNEEETHHGLKYHDGLNEDPLEFNPSGNCEPGGIYFAKEDILAFLDYGPWIRQVIIPKGEPIYENPGSPKKWKAKRVILGPRREIDLQVIKELVEEGADIHARDDCALRSWYKLSNSESQLTSKNLDSLKTATYTVVEDKTYGRLMFLNDNVAVENELVSLAKKKLSEQAGIDYDVPGSKHVDKPNDGFITADCEKCLKNNCGQWMPPKADIKLINQFESCYELNCKTRGLNYVCKECDKLALTSDGKKASQWFKDYISVLRNKSSFIAKDAIFEGVKGPNPVYIKGIKCWRRYRLGSWVTMKDVFNSIIKSACFLSFSKVLIKIMCFLAEFFLEILGFPRLYQLFPPIQALELYRPLVD